MGSGRSLLRHPDGSPRLLAPGLVTLAVAFALAMLGARLVLSARTGEERARALLRSGKAAEAELVYARLAREEPSVPVVLALLHAHEAARAQAAMPRDPTVVTARVPLPEQELDAILSALPPDVALIARFVRPRSEEDAAAARREVEEGADRAPPLAWANHVLAREAAGAGRTLDAARRYLREGLSFPDRRADVDQALAIWIAEDAWDEVRGGMQDPRIAGAASAPTRYRIAVHDRNWRAAVRTLPGVWRPRLDAGNLVLASVAALAWAFFCARLGKLGDRPAIRVPLYAAAFVLGALSVVPVMLLDAVEEAALRLVETGDLARDILYFVFGVGLREEASKLLLFAPLLVVLRRWGDKLDVLVCGALCGLGFAAEENLGYLAGENLSTSLARFLTANFLHMAMTGILASALDDFLRDREKHAQEFLRTTVLVVALHGAYDLLLSHAELGGPWLAMSVFVLLTKAFLDAAGAERRRADRGLTPLHAFVLALAVVTGTALAHAVVLVGPRAAGVVMAQGLLGEAVIVLVFFRSLRGI